MRYCEIVLIALLLGGCKEQPPTPSTPMPLNKRVIATVYAIHTTQMQGIPCFAAPYVESFMVTHLLNKQMVDLVSVAEGTLKLHNQYWLHIKPRLESLKPDSCFIQTDYLTPLA